MAIIKLPVFCFEALHAPIMCCRVRTMLSNALKEYGRLQYFYIVRITVTIKLDFAHAMVENSLDILSNTRKTALRHWVAAIFVNLQIV